MPDETRHESADLDDYQVQDSTDTLSGAPGDDPLDRGVVPPERWSAGIRYGTTETEQESGESLDQLLAEEEPDDTLDLTEAELSDDEEEEEEEEEEETEDPFGDEETEEEPEEDDPPPKRTGGKRR